MSSIDYDKVKSTVISGRDNLLVFNFKERDGSDPLGVDDFVRNRMSVYIENKVCVVYVVRHEKKIVGFYTLSMGALEKKGHQIKENDMIGDAPQLVKYPAVLLGNMGIDIGSRGKGLGRWIVDYLIGQIMEFSMEIGCSYVFLQTNESKRGFYEKLYFSSSGKKDIMGRLWMYRRLFTKRVSVSFF